jgi:hypothetical protein
MDFWIQILAGLLGGFAFGCADGFGHRAVLYRSAGLSYAGAAQRCLKLAGLAQQAIAMSAML